MGDHVSHVLKNVVVKDHCSNICNAQQNDVCFGANFCVPCNHLDIYMISTEMGGVNFR